jgi:hypothetical protein
MIRPHIRGAPKSSTETPLKALSWYPPWGVQIRERFLLTKISPKFCFPFHHGHHFTRRAPKSVIAF